MNPNVSGSPPGAHQRQSPHTNRYAPYASPSPPGYPYTYLNQGGAGGGGGGGHMIPSNNQFHQSHQFPFDPYQNIYRPAAAFNNNRPPVYPTSQQQYSYNSYQDFNNQHQNPSPPHPNRSFSPGHYQQNRYQNRSPNENQGNYKPRHGGNHHHNHHHYQQQHHHRSNNKATAKRKIDKRDLPENNKFYCEVCDRGFKTEDKYQEHCGTHVTCRINGCNFTAAEKLVEIHYRNFHATGIDKKVSKLETVEEIQKYINDRKKNFPTKKNVNVKSNVRDEKIQRGARLTTKEFGRLKTNKTKLAEKTDQAPREGSILNKEEDDGEEGELDEESSGKSPNNEENSPNSNENDSSMPSRFNESHHRKGNNKKRSHAKKNKRTNAGSFSQKIQAIKSRYKAPTLLQKLLADEIRHERNIILQCVRYVVQNNFFDRKVLVSTTTHDSSKKQDD